MTTSSCAICTLPEGGVIHTPPFSAGTQHDFVPLHPRSARMREQTGMTVPPHLSDEERAHDTATASGIDQEGSTARTEAQAREFGPREVAPRARKCRGHWHPNDWDDRSFSDEEAANAAALRAWAEEQSYDDRSLLESLAVAEEDRFNESGMYIPNEIPGILRRIAADLVKYRALAATTEVVAGSVVLAVDPSRSTPAPAVAVPTPPSDAGTSERETPYPPCAYCGGSPWEHEAATTGRTICRQYRSRIVDGAAAPAAEGPRDDDDGDDSYMVCEVRVNIGEAMEECGESLPCHRHGPKPAALPGAEAGTPHRVAKTMSLADYLDARCTGHADCPVPHAEFAALTSEVRALREDKARLDWMDEHTAGVDVADNEVGTLTVQSNLDYRQVGGGEAIRAAIDAARLASPSPTGAPAEQQTHEG